MEATPYIWMNGELVDWDDAQVHVGVHGLHYGSGVFEGVRCYETPRGPAVFRLTDHMRRLETSGALIHMKLPYSVAELVQATHDLLGANGLPACYVRPIAFYGYGTLGVPPRQNPVYVAIMSWPWGTYLGAEALERGIRCKISSWRRVGPNTIPHAAKATGVYLNSMLAVTEANRAGYDEALLLTEDGYVGDGSGENIFVVKDGVLYTPDLSASILPGITRDSIFQIAGDLGYEVRPEAAHPHRPLRGRRAVHDGNGGGGDADSLGGRPRGRRPGADHQGDPDDVPGHGCREGRPVRGLARIRPEVVAGRGQLTRRVLLSRPHRRRV